MEARPAPAEGPRLVRAIGRWDLTANVVNGVIGAGIFGIPSGAAERLGPWSPLAFVFAALGIFLVVLCFAEVGSRYDQSGGPYLYTREAFGEHVGFQVGWLHVWTRLLSAAAILDVFVRYLSQLAPWAATTTGRAVVMTVVFGFVTALNVWGVRQAVWAVNALTIAKLLPLVALILLGLPQIRGEVLASQVVEAPRWADALLFVIFAYGGFESGIVAASETRDPRRDHGFALVVSIVTVTLVYCLIQLVVVGVLPQAKDTNTPVAGTLAVLLGPAGALLGSVAAMISGYGWLNSFALSVPRISFAMAERRELPAFLARVHPRFRTPHVAVVVTSLAGLALALLGSFEHTANLSVVTRLGIYVLVCAALPVLRGRRPQEAPGFRLRGGPYVAGAGILFCLGLLVTRSYEQMGWLFAIMAAGILLRRVSGRAATRVTLAA
jgi:basic amino acid/polyamine antiporter, APA family